MISVCIPTFNGERFIKHQLDSILVQLSENDEIIISDDSSTDKTVEIIRGYKDNRIKLFENCKYRSPIFNLENALNHAKGDYIFLSDQDDVWEPQKVEIIFKFFLEYDLVVSDCKIINEEEKVIIDSFFKTVNARNGFFHNLIKNGYLGCCMAFKRNILAYVLPFPKKIAMHDIWIGLMTEIIGKSLFLNQSLILYRKHNTNVTPFTGIRSTNSFFYKLSYRIVILYLILRRFICFKLNLNAKS